MLPVRSASGSASAGARVLNGDRMWHCVEGIQNWDPVWPKHGIRILPGPSSVWLYATGYDHSWFVLTQAIIEKEFALSGSEQNPDLTGKSVRELLTQRLGKGAAAPVEAFKEHGADFIVADTLAELLDGMQQLTPDIAIDAEHVRREVEARDRELTNKFTKDSPITALRQARNYLGDKLIRVAKPHRILDPKAGPLIAVKLNILTRKSLGGIQTDLSARALEGTFLGGCLFSGSAAGRSVARRSVATE
ncbi:FAD-binding dehydrogenase [Salinibacterium sp. NYA9b]